MVSMAYKINRYIINIIIHFILVACNPLSRKLKFAALMPLFRILFNFAFENPINALCKPATNIVCFANQRRTSHLYFTLIMRRGGIAKKRQHARRLPRRLASLLIYSPAESARHVCLPAFSYRNLAKAVGN